MSDDKPVNQKITRYLEATGNTAAIASVDLVARVQGFVQSISYTDGAAVKTGDILFTIEPLPYQAKLQQAQAAEASAQATLVNAQTNFSRQESLQRGAVFHQHLVVSAIGVELEDLQPFGQAPTHQLTSSSFL